MRCRKVRNLLNRYLAGECRSSEAAEIARHLEGCPQCRGEEEALRQLDRLLDLWQPGPAPQGLMESVMAGVTQDGSTARSSLDGSARKGSFMQAGRRRMGRLLLDLVAAAAASISVLWGFGPRLEGYQAPAALKGPTEVMSLRTSGLPAVQCQRRPA